jgi:hypothetical protein
MLLIDDLDARRAALANLDAAGMVTQLKGGAPPVCGSDVL